MPIKNHGIDPKSVLIGIGINAAVLTGIDKHTLGNDPGSPDFNVVIGNYHSITICFV